MIYRIILVVLIAICKALVDTISHHKGGVFKGRPFFDITKQGKILPLTKYPFDGFHVFNSLMILFSIMAMLPLFHSEVVWYIQFSVYSVIYILVFNLFWNKIFN